jgi:hypothetical protein
MSPLFSRSKSDLVQDQHEGGNKQRLATDYMAFSQSSVCVNQEIEIKHLKVSNLTSYPMGIGGGGGGTKNRGKKNVNLYNHSPIRLHGIVLNQLSTRTTLPLHGVLSRNIEHSNGSIVCNFYLRKR